MVDDADRQARLCLSCALDGGDPAVMGLVARHGPAAAWSHILNGAMGEPTATMSRSTYSKLRCMRSSCPRVMGSKLPA